MTSKTTGSIERISSLVYRAPVDTNKQNRQVRRDYYSRFRVRRHNTEWDNWRLHVGDVVAVSTTHNESHLISLQEIDDWEPNHLKKPSRHWKVALILALTHVVDIEDPSKSTYECHVEWIEKLLDLPCSSKVSQVYRPFQRVTEKCRRPCVLARTFQFGMVHPLNILPLKVDMLGDDDFREGVLCDPHERYQLRMCCRYWIDSDSTFQPDASLNHWPKLNHSSFTKNINPKSVPQPLQESWSRWLPTLNNSDLGHALIQGTFEDSSSSKFDAYLHFRNLQLLRERKQQEESDYTHMSASGNKRKQEYTSQSSSVASRATLSKKVRITEPGSKYEPEGGNHGKPSSKTVQKSRGEKGRKTDWLRCTATNNKRSQTRPFPSLPHLELEPVSWKITAPEAAIYTGNRDRQHCKFYETITLSIGNYTRQVLLGDVVLASLPEDVKVMQVVAMYCVSKFGEWRVLARLFQRYNEANTKQRQHLKRRKVHPEFGLVETASLESLSIASILPTRVKITSDPVHLRQNDLASDKTDLVLCCQHVFDEKRQVYTVKKDWSDFDPTSRALSAPFQRALQCKGLSPALIKKYEEMITAREDVYDSSDDELSVNPLSNKPLLVQWGNKFFDGVEIQIDEGALGKPFVPRQTTWTVHVGYVVPIRCETEGKRSGRSKHSYPFSTNWSAAQIVSIYLNSRNEWKMQVRWFQYYTELLKHLKPGVNDLNQPHIVFETEIYDEVDVDSCLPGRILLTSSQQAVFTIKHGSDHGLPIIPRFCSHICLDEDLDISMDWSGYDSALSTCPKPFMRGLQLDPRNRKNKSWITKLARVYTVAAKKRLPDPDQNLFETYSPPAAEAISMVLNSTSSFNPTETKVSLGRVVTSRSSKDTSYELSATLFVEVPLRYMVSPPPRIKSSAFTVHVGDVVCYFDENAGLRSDRFLSGDGRNPWFPFHVPWSFGQVTAAYTTQRRKTKNPTRVEIRKLLRLSDLPSAAQEFAPISRDKELEEVYESDEILEEMEASRILGLSSIFLGKHRQDGKILEGGIKSEAVAASCRCEFLYHFNVKQFQLIHCTSLSPSIWMSRFLERGSAVSKLRSWIDNVPAMAKPVSQTESMDVDHLTIGQSPSHALQDHEVLFESNSSPKLFKRAKVSIDWSQVALPPAFYHHEDRKNDFAVEIGQFVAMKSSDTEGNLSTTHHPFSCPWRPCQVLSIFSKDEEEALQCEIAYLTLHCPRNELASVEIPSTVERDVVGVSGVLGPIVLVPRGRASRFDWNSIPANLPYATMIAAESVTNDIDTFLAHSRIYSDQDMDKVRSYMKQAHMRRNTPKGKAREEAIPFHGDITAVDRSRLRRYFSTMQTSPGTQYFCLNHHSKIARCWEVKEGDVVIVRCDGPQRYPFKCNWAVAEIVTMWEQFESTDSLENATRGQGLSHVRLEIRWFYNVDDIALAVSKSVGVAPHEVFETDDVFVLDNVDELLAPAGLVDTASSPSSVPLEGDIHVHKFLCQRFWSTKRNTFVPCGELSGRVKRARLYSKECQVFNKGDANTGGPGKADAQCKEADPQRWKQAFRDVIANLNLKEASTGVYERGDSLVGREAEMSRLLSLFRAALKGDDGPGQVRSSFFLAGPPGGGKTACVRAAIVRLRNEQKEGDVPPFNFISLNAMEMRNPYEAYVRFLEELTGYGHTGSYEKARKALEDSLTSPESEGQKEKPVTVLLLDEIDYLVTEKNSVLYDFFNWPRRALSVGGRPRLVVVGISNTLNLAEQLMPRLQSRMDAAMIAFKAYNVDDAKSILEAKVQEVSQGYNVFDSDAMKFAAKKTAAMSGDIRKAFTICRAAAEMVLQRHEDEKENANTGNVVHPVVRISDVQKASRQSFETTLLHAISFSSAFQSLLLVSLASLCRTTGREVGGFEVEELMRKMEALVGSSGHKLYSPAPSFSETLHLLSSLAENNLIRLATTKSSMNFYRGAQGGGGAWPKVTLLVDEHTILRGLRSTVHKNFAETVLPPVV